MSTRREIRVPAASCKCSGCEGLARRYQNDPVVLGFYRKKLLIRGWPGGTDDVEKEYMASHADWYKAAQERGRQTSARTGWGKRKTGIGEASTPPTEVNTILP